MNRSSAASRLWAHLGILLSTSLVIAVADCLMIRFSLFGASGAYKYVPLRLWFIAPLCWLGFVLVSAIPVVAVFRRYGSLLASAAWVFFLLAQSASKSQRLTFVIVAVAVPILLGVAIYLVRRAVDWRWKPVTLALIAVFVLLLGGTIAASGRFDNRRSSASASAQGPNVLVVFLDTVRYDAIFARDGSVHPHLPTFRRLASESVVYDYAYSASGWTLPSHLAALTGVEAHKLGIDFDQQEYTGIPTIAQKYRRRGYRTLAVTSNPWMSAVGRDLGDFDRWEYAQNALDVCRIAPFRYLEPKLRIFGMGLCMWGASEVTSRAIRLMPGEEPFFMLLNLMDAHTPYDTTRECGGELGGIWMRWEPRTYRRHYADDYARAVRCLDAKLAPLLDAAVRSPRGTIVTVLSDHGEQFGEHKLVLHSNSLYPQLLHVPMMMRWPDGAGRRVTETTSIVDLPDLLEKKPVRTPGTALATLVFPRARWRPSRWAVVRGEWQMIGSDRDRYELFNLREDPGAEIDRIDDPALAPLAAELRAEIARMRKEMPPRRETAFRSLGYLR